MTRRAVGLLVVLAIFLAPLAAYAQPATAQQGRSPRVGYLNPRAATSPPELGFKAFQDTLRERGYVDRQNILIASTGGRKGRRIGSAELVRLRVDVIFAVSSAALRAARNATRTIPIVALDLETDPVASGLASSLAHPGGNIRGVFLDQPELDAKWQ